jgi:LAS superfamily LD-carboxypeptidase LdcB
VKELPACFVEYYIQRKTLVKEADSLLIRQLVATVALAASLMEGAMYKGMPQMDVEGQIFLVNRQQEMSEAYVPETVEAQVSGTTRRMRPDAAQALEEMFAVAKKEAKITFLTVSGYRSFPKQKTVYGKKVKATGSETKAQEYVAPPGCSEHQLGLAMDVGAKGASSGLNGSFGKTKAGKWLKENAHRFGFIIRYPQEWVEVTGYNYEPWHVRYVGVDHATAMYEQQIPMETYMQSLQAEAILDILEP